ncbi:MAG: hypothetical protein LBU55_03350 [Elusimicrobiota bacterium]|jgi:hypothetical protein|nr:hypothetical protein [Elusimicrobiota bacterium]
MKNLLLFTILSVFIISRNLYASSSLLFLEFQGIGGYSFSGQKFIYHSVHEDDVMQKNSAGFDFIKKFSSDTSDILTLALQVRAAYEDVSKKVQLQIYNAYLKTKTSYVDIWAGHNRIAFGLESYWDTHGTLIQPLSMHGFGFDRDWGIGISKDTQKGNVQAALSLATGMAFSTQDNWLISSRISHGVLSYDNYTAGVSFMGGKTLEVMGFDIMKNGLKSSTLFAFDFAYNHNNFEHKTELVYGLKNSTEAAAGLYNFSVNFLEENKLKLEVQGIYTKIGNNEKYFCDVGVSYKINSDLTIRTMYEYVGKIGESKVVGQIYYYFFL